MSLAAGGGGASHIYNDSIIISLSLASVISLMAIIYLIYIFTGAIQELVTMTK